MAATTPSSAAARFGKASPVAIQAGTEGRCSRARRDTDRDDLQPEVGDQELGLSDQRADGASTHRPNVRDTHWFTARIAIRDRGSCPSSAVVTQSSDASSVIPQHASTMRRAIAGEDRRRRPPSIVEPGLGRPQHNVRMRHADWSYCASRPHGRLSPLSSSSSATDRSPVLFGDESCTDAASVLRRD
jgi:hypothetical protein